MEQYIILIVAIVCGIFLLKKVASCIIRIVISLVMLAVVAYAYYYFKGEQSQSDNANQTEMTQTTAE